MKRALIIITTVLFTLFFSLSSDHARAQPVLGNPAIKKPQLPPVLVLRTEKGPENLALTKITPTSVSLRWEPPTGAPVGMKYVVSYRQAAGSLIKLTSSPITATDYNHEGLIPDTRLTWYIVAIYPDGKSGRAVIEGKTFPGKNPAGFRGYVSGNNVELSWDSVPFAKSYRLHGSNVYPPKFIQASEPSQYKISGVTPGTHTYWLVSFYKTSQGDYGDENNPSEIQLTVEADTVLGDAYQDLEGNRHMHTNATIYKNSGLLMANTKIWTNNAFWGFTGGIVVWAVDSSDNVIGATPLQQYGVDGTAILGKESSRSIMWSHSFDPAVAANTKRLVIIQSYDPKNRLEDIMSEIISTGEKVKDKLEQLCGKLPELCQAAKAYIAAGL
jgi:hypothetical protein